mgnify:CR=1 FL=1
MTESNQKSSPENNAPAVTASKDKWDIFEIVVRPISAAFTALAIAAIGWYGNQAITSANNIQEETRARIADREQDARLYTQLLSSREESESALRKDMFQQIMDGFFDGPKDSCTSVDKSGCDINDEISIKILRMEMLALNFGDSLSLGTLFGEMSKDIDRILEASHEEIDDWKFDAAIHQKRLQGLARRVASSQLSTIAPKAGTIKARIPFEKIEKTGSIASEEWQYTWPVDYQTDSAEGMPKNELLIGRVARSITIQLRDANYRKKTVRVKLIIEDLDEESAAKEPTEIEFSLDYFNFPLIDNTRLSDNERFAIVLEEFNRRQLVLKGVLFPGVYASQRDKPYLNEAIQDLKIQQKTIKNIDEQFTPDTGSEVNNGNVSGQ